MQRSIDIIIVIAIFSMLCSNCLTNVTNGELQALNDLYTACSGANWVNNTNWLTGDPCGNYWFGVSCTNGHVTSLTLITNGLYGTLPSTLSNLYLLDTLNLEDNEISGAIPDSLNQIKSLGTINFKKNFLSSSIPNDIGDLLAYNLGYLDLSDNQLSGAIPTFFENAPAYFYANLSNNLFACPIPSWAEYTSATCVQWEISIIDPLCTFPMEDINVYGSNFMQVGDLRCNFYNISTNEFISSSKAVVVSDTHLVCQANYTFSMCNGYPGHTTFINLNLILSLNGQVITGNTSTQIGLVNYLCSFGSQISGYMIPSLPEVLSVCPFGNPYFYYCPSSLPALPTSRSVAAVVKPSCSMSESNSTCFWAKPINSISNQYCSYYYCSSYCYLSYQCQSNYPCYIQKSDCISDTTCSS